MRAISGCVGPSADDLLERCRRSLSAQRIFGSVIQVQNRGWICLGATSQDDDEAFASSGALSLVADARIDNRDELRGHLALPVNTTDPQIILALWSRHGFDAPKHLSGAFAFAVADDDTRTVHLVRDQVGSRPLLLRKAGKTTAFSSMASGLLDSSSRSPNLGHLARRLQGENSPSSETAWNDVQLIAKSSVTSINGETSSVRRYFDPSQSKFELDRGDYVDSLRAELERAVGLSLSSSGDVVAAHLSSGLDSSAVASFAARLTGSSKSLIFYTSAPAYSDRNLSDKGRRSDEAAISRATADWLGAEHVVVRDRSRIADQIRGRTRFFEDAVPNPINLGWWIAINEAARGRGAHTILTGLSGNASISYGGLSALSEHLSRGEFLIAAREAIAAHRHNDVSWTGIGFSALEPFLPEPAGRWMARNLRPQSIVVNSPFLSASGHEMAGRSKKTFGTRRVAPRLRVLARSDDSLRNKGMQALTGIEERDPLAEPRLLEYCFATPPETRLLNGRYKPVLKDALSGLVPPAIINQSLRGEQGSDWYARIDRRDSLNLLEEARASAAARELLDFRRLHDAIENWPAFDRNTRGPLLSFFYQLIDALAVGIFLAESERYPLGQ